MEEFNNLIFNESEDSIDNDLHIYSDMCPTDSYDDMEDVIKKDEE